MNGSLRFLPALIYFRYLEHVHSVFGVVYAFIPAYSNSPIRYVHLLYWILAQLSCYIGTRFCHSWVCMSNAFHPYTHLHSILSAHPCSFGAAYGVVLYLQLTAPLHASILFRILFARTSCCPYKMILSQSRFFCRFDICDEIYFLASLALHPPICFNMDGRMASMLPVRIHKTQRLTSAY